MATHEEFTGLARRESRTNTDVYTAGMDASLEIKFEQIAPHVVPGCIVDYGCGTGMLAKLLSQKFRGSLMGIVDDDSFFFHLALQNLIDLRELAVMKGDLGEMLFAPGVATTVIYSSVLHEYYSDNGYSEEALHRVLEKSFRELAPGGRIIIRDGLKPFPGKWALEPRRDDGVDCLAEDVKFLSTEAMLRRFIGEFSSAVRPVAAMRSGGFWILDKKDAYEFLMKKDYRENWSSEVREVFGYWDSAEFENALAAAGFRVVRKELYRNPWIIENRLAPCVEIHEADDKGRGLGLCAFPHTNIIIVGEKPR